MFGDFGDPWSAMFGDLEIRAIWRSVVGDLEIRVRRVRRSQVEK